MSIATVFSEGAHCTEIQSDQLISNRTLEEGLRKRTWLKLIVRGGYFLLSIASRKYLRAFDLLETIT